MCAEWLPWEVLVCLLLFWIQSETHTSKNYDCNVTPTLELHHQSQHIVPSVCCMWHIIMSQLLVEHSSLDMRKTRGHTTLLFSPRAINLGVSQTPTLASKIHHKTNLPCTFFLIQKCWCSLRLWQQSGLPPKLTWRRCKMDETLSVVNRFHVQWMTVQCMTSNCSHINETCASTLRIQMGSRERHSVFQQRLSSAFCCVQCLAQCLIQMRKTEHPSHC